MTATRIAEIRAHRLSMPLTEPFAIATGSQDAAHNVLVEVCLDDGSVGIGEGAPLTVVTSETQAQTLAAVESLGPSLVGCDARDWRGLAREMAEAAPGAASGRCALEIAILDALSRSDRTPLWRLFGGAGAKVAIDMTVTAGDRQHAVASARRICDLGIGTIKIKVGALDPVEDAERVDAVRGVAPGARLFVDANSGWSLEQARAFLAEVARRELPLALFEQPVADREDLATLARESPIPVCADESVRSAADVRWLAAAGVPAINIKLMKCGVAEAWQMWEAARETGTDLMIGAMVEGPVAISFGVHFAAGLGGFSFVDLDTVLFIAEHPFSGGAVRTGPQLDVSEVVAGIGVGWNSVPAVPGS